MRTSKTRFQKNTMWIRAGAGIVVAVILIYGGVMASRSGWMSLFFTSDQKGQYLFRKGEYPAAAEAFRDPFWQATAWYRAGEFKKAAGIFTGFDTAQGAYNHGNALAMQGQYEDAVSRFERALVLKPGWEDAQVNLTIARQNAEKLKQKGGEGTGGQLEADEIRFSKNKSDDNTGGEEIVEGETKLGEAEMRAMWLRRVQTKPADFLRAKFAYQQQFQEKSE